MTRGTHRSWLCLMTAITATLLSTLSIASAQNAMPVSRLLPATETWVCTDQAQSTHHERPPIELALKDGFLIERPLGSPRYELLVNNEHALIGVDHHGDFDPVLGMINIFVSTVTIDRSTGEFSITTSVRQHLHEHRAGRCRMFDDRRAAGVALHR